MIETEEDWNNAATGSFVFPTQEKIEEGEIFLDNVNQDIEIDWKFAGVYPTQADLDELVTGCFGFKINKLTVEPIPSNLQSRNIQTRI